MSLILFEGFLNNDDIEQATEMDFSVYAVVPNKGKLRFNHERDIDNCLKLFTHKACRCEFTSWYRTRDLDKLILSEKDKQGMIEMGNMLTPYGHLYMSAIND